MFTKISLKSFAKFHDNSKLHSSEKEYSRITECR